MGIVGPVLQVECQFPSITKGHGQRPRFEIRGRRLGNQTGQRQRHAGRESGRRRPFSFLLFKETDFEIQQGRIQIVLFLFLFFAVAIIVFVNGTKVVGILIRRRLWNFPDHGWSFGHKALLVFGIIQHDHFGMTGKGDTHGPLVLWINARDGLNLQSNDTGCKRIRWFDSIGFRDKDHFGSRYSLINCMIRATNSILGRSDDKGRSIQFTLLDLNGLNGARLLLGHSIKGLVTHFAQANESNLARLAVPSQ
mmetsp:Transcript_44602/g.107467  ORF Transcript_44602/g.107467 Transcript_44602/m.107467 type:complete len:251 (-) Transcript_44602:1480-2232(-)